jgi:adenylosuccinate lyase
MGSSAVPVKRNPIKSERVSSLSKLVRSQVAVSFENIPLWHERDLSNSANERFVIPTVSILVDEMLETMTRIVSNLMVNEKRIVDNLYITKGQIFAEFVLEALIKKGIPRFVAYRDVQRVAFEANDKGMFYKDAIKKDKAFSSKLTEKEIDAIFSPEKHLGASPAIISNVEKTVQKTIKKFI